MLDLVSRRTNTYDAYVADEVPGPWVRRPTSVVGILVATALSPVIAPIALIVSNIIDRFQGQTRFQRTRAAALITGLILIDFVGMVGTNFVWLTSPFGRNVQSPRVQARYSKLMTWWTSQLLAAISRASVLPLDRSQLDESLLGGNAIVIGRHRSLLDAILPAVIFGNLGVTARYVLKEDLQWDINIDVVGNRMGHVFVDRTPENLEDELAPIRQLGRRIDSQSVGVIFPEGTFFNEKRKARAVTYLRDINDRHADIAEKLEYLLPPRPAGTLALLEGAPEADIIVLGHVGFEAFGTIGDILDNLGANERIKLMAWRFPRKDVPIEPDQQIDWLFDRWLDMDEWIAANQPIRG